MMITCAILDGWRSTQAIAAGITQSPRMVLLSSQLHSAYPTEESQQIGKQQHCIIGYHSVRIHVLLHVLHLPTSIMDVYDVVGQW